MSATPSVRWDRADQIVRVALSNPGKRNAITSAMWRDLERFLAEAPRPDDRVVILEGEGVDFCAGVDLTDPDRRTHETQQERIEWMGGIVSGVRSLSIPVIAKVDGTAFGIGMNLALACDLVVASDRARFSEVFVKRALSVDGGGTWMLPRLIGEARARELCLLAEEIDGMRAERIGLVNRCVSVTELEATVAGIAERLRASAPTAVSHTKSLLNRAWDTTFDDAVVAEATAQCESILSPEFAASLHDFQSRRASVVHERRGIR